MAQYPTFHFVENAQSDDASRRQTDRENSSRPAVVEVQQVSIGTGQHRLPKVVQFPIVFRDEPHFTFGSAVISGPSKKIYNDPRGSSGVYAWQQNSSGHYIGAFCWVRVDIDPLERSVQTTTGTTSAGALEAALQELSDARASLLTLEKIKVQHYMTFSGTGMKTLSYKGMALNPRAVHI